MSELVIAEKQDLVDIADAIRTKTGTTDTFTLSEMPQIITSISGGGAELVNVSITSTNWSGGAWYTDSNYQLTYVDIFGGETLNITCIKGSAVIFSGYGFSPNIDAIHCIDYTEDYYKEEGLYIYKFTSHTSMRIHNIEMDIV